MTVADGEPAEIRLKWKYRRPQANGHQKSSASGHSGVNRHRGETRKDVREAAQAVTKAHTPILVLTSTGKRRWVRPWLEQ